MIQAITFRFSLQGYSTLSKLNEFDEKFDLYKGGISIVTLWELNYTIIYQGNIWDEKGGAKLKSIITYLQSLIKHFQNELYSR